ncbi:hypothetical protein V8E36_006253 [Tilletia maclaganii]
MVSIAEAAAAAAAGAAAAASALPSPSPDHTTTTTVHTIAAAALRLLLVRIPYNILLLCLAANSVFLIYVLFRWGSRFLTFALGRDHYAFLPIPTPPGPAWQFPFLGHFKAILAAHPAEAHLAYMRKVGSPIYTYRTILFATRVFIADPKAIAYILSSQNSYDFEKPKFVRDYLSNILGQGILVSEGEPHRRARRVLQPAFTPATIRALTPVFFKYALQLRRNLLDLVDNTEGPASRSFIPGQSDTSASISSKGKPVFNVSIWLSLTTMDIIGEAGFGHRFNALKDMADKGSTDGQDVIRRAFVSATAAAEHPTKFDMALVILSRITRLRLFQYVPTRRSRRIARQYALLQSVSRHIIAQKKAEVLEEMESVHLQSGGSGHGIARQNGIAARAELDLTATTSSTTSTATKQMFDDLNDGVEKPRDIIHQMLRANLSKDLPAAMRLRDDEMLPQITTLLLAGQETTSTQLTWCLYLLSKPENKHFQTALRNEVREVFGGRDEVRPEELQSLKLLDQVMLETMRLKSAVPSSLRVPARDHVLPLSQAYTSRDGKTTFDRLPIKRGQDLFIFIQALNRAPHLWGEDADVFNPGRWEALPESLGAGGGSPDWSSGHPAQSLWTFLAGPRGCSEYAGGKSLLLTNKDLTLYSAPTPMSVSVSPSTTIKVGRAFAIAEFKAILATLIRDLEFDVIPDWEIEPKQDVVLSPRVKGQEHLKKQMPLRVSRVA